MIFRFICCAILLLFCSRVFAGEIALDFARGDYDQAYQDNQYTVSGRATLPDPKYKIFGAYSYTDRNYRELVHLYKNAFVLGGSVEVSSWKSYFEAIAMTSDSDLIGALNRYTFIPHTTAFKNFDLALGLDNATYSTGDVFSVSPQILYFLSDYWIFGHTSWAFNDDGWHYAWRNFVRARQSSWSEEISIAGGETKEDVGVIDRFSSVGGSVKYYTKKFSLGFTLERYDGHLRRGWQGGAQLSCPF